jgi:hypothetical protein
LVKLIDEFPIAKSHWFPIFGFVHLVPDLQKAETLKIQQKSKLSNNLKNNVIIDKVSSPFFLKSIKMDTTELQKLIHFKYVFNLESWHTKLFLKINK